MSGFMYTLPGAEQFLAPGESRVEPSGLEHSGCFGVAPATVDFAVSAAPPVLEQEQSDIRTQRPTGRYFSMPVPS